MKRMLLKSNGYMSASTLGATGDPLECDENVNTFTLSDNVSQLFTAMLGEMQQDEISEIHIEMNGGKDFVHIVRNNGDVDLGDRNDYPVFALIDEWILEFHPEIDLSDETLE